MNNKFEVSIDIDDKYYEFDNREGSILKFGNGEKNKNFGNPTNVYVSNGAVGFLVKPESFTKRNPDYSASNGQNKSVDILNNGLLRLLSSLGLYQKFSEIVVKEKEDYVNKNNESSQKLHAEWVEMEEAFLDSIKNFREIKVSEEKIIAQLGKHIDEKFISSLHADEKTESFGKVKITLKGSNCMDRFMSSAIESYRAKAAAEKQPGSEE